MIGFVMCLLGWLVSNAPIAALRQGEIASRTPCDS